MTTVFELKPIPENLGRCYELSAYRVGFGSDGEYMLTGGYAGSTLVHGTIQGFGHDPIGHGWVIEPDGMVWEPATAKAWPPDVFEALFNPVVHVTYTPAEARAKMAETEHYGCWHD